ncbi:hypothetical protein GCM10022630_40400 [Thermobifida alba]
MSTISTRTADPPFPAATAFQGTPAPPGGRPPVTPYDARVTDRRGRGPVDARPVPDRLSAPPDGFTAADPADGPTRLRTPS